MIFDRASHIIFLKSFFLAGKKKVRVARESACVMGHTSVCIGIIEILHTLHSCFLFLIGEEESLLAWHNPLCETLRHCMG